ncbi:HD domain-containing phosphohydrolase [Limnoglobus roseus]|uniref:Response regulator receiver modulated metal-depenent phosphohydrolase n=1 Tax=Limnoglobus roseus TaxID=2598579 RepID=A0A5C1AE31_9BACT|nr:HD domain-containing phosphohydrolase [Limnoglobus roseus]QEL16835.1 response regulator receiver modulated metal-depenent phosphohydrolase [Limnoglobus roseus]
MSEKILFVDDEPNVLAGYERQLRKRFAVHTAPGGEQALGMLAADGPFAVIVSDMRMPGMNGVQFLSEVRVRQPESVRMLLTGNADVESAIDAVNRGGLFRFLSKPCDAMTLARSLTDALTQYRLVTAERELLDRTLKGSVQVLGEVLALVNPAAFGRALRVQKLALEIAAVLNTPIGWEVEVAAILAQLGYVAVPERVLTLADRGKDLTSDEQLQLNAAPTIAVELIGRIPRLERVIQVIAHIGTRYDIATVNGKFDSLPLGSRLLRVSRDFDILLTRGIPKAQVVEHLRMDAGRYDPALLDALDQLVRNATRPQSRVLPVAALEVGMVLDEDLFSTSGTFLLRHGNAITLPLKYRLEQFANAGHIPPTLRVSVPIDLTELIQ